MSPVLVVGKLNLSEPSSATGLNSYASDKTEEQRDKELATVDKTIEAGVRARAPPAPGRWSGALESEGAIRTCEATIIKAAIAMDTEEEDLLDAWTGDAEMAEGKGTLGPAAQAILAYALRVFPD
ncbi:hypothetical protein GSI_03505 [Ganoderma sinense ZZ0214-1]|uniref:Uncharacterized protein n=1 Tax=Ganoderma sinense ZZ0214-1 TaxID=1077348 RepID=A0A2G8SLT6_9APHY|nr:hypothetical protein GSI_03505 [Ganoderma sinense ZZ0214-1]